MAIAAITTLSSGHANPSTTARYDRRPEEVRRQAAAKLHLPYVPPQGGVIARGEPRAGLMLLGLLWLASMAWPWRHRQRFAILALLLAVVAMIDVRPRPPDPYCWPSVASCPLSAKRRTRRW